MTATLRRTARNAPAPAPFVSTRTCRPCQGTGVGATFGSVCTTCTGTGDAPSMALRHRRRAVENEAPRPTEGQIDLLAQLIDRVDHRHPEQQYAADLIGRTDATEAQVLATIAALEPLVPPRVPRETRLLRQPRRNRAQQVLLVRQQRRARRRWYVAMAWWCATHPRQALVWARAWVRYGVARARHQIRALR